MKTLSSFLDRIANWKTLLLVLAIYICFPVYFLKNAETKINALAEKPVGPIDLTMGFAPEKTLKMVAAYGEQARAYYATVETTIDVAYPIIYALLFGIILTLLFRNASYKPYKYVNLLPFVMLFFDFSENVAIVILLKSYPDQSLLVATFCEIFKLAKWISFGIIILLILYGLFMRLLSKQKTV